MGKALVKESLYNLEASRRVVSGSRCTVGRAMLTRHRVIEVCRLCLAVGA